MAEKPEVSGSIYAHDLDRIHTFTINRGLHFPFGGLVTRRVNTFTVD
jgi:hypothetical protein